MLTRLSVRRLAVVDDLELEFLSGMTSLTGETGAGKSLVVNALSLVLGDRANSSMVRKNSERAEVEASFDISKNSELQNWLIQQELDDSTQCHLRRTISKDGRSRGYINGRAVPLKQLRAISERSIDIHGQHAHQSLIRPDTQRQLLDTAANNKALLDELSDSYKQWQSLKHQLEWLTQQSQAQSVQLELLQYQVNELEQYELTDESISKLLSEQNQLAYATQLISTAESAIHQLFDQEPANAYGTISHILADIESLQEVEPKFAEMLENLNSIIIQLDECGSELRHYIDHADINPSRLEEVENTLSSLHDLARKHQIEIEQLPNHYQVLCDQLDNITHISQNQSELQQQLETQKQQYLDLCAQISNRRQKAAKPLAKQITDSIQQLAIPTGQINIIVESLSNEQFNETGGDLVQLLVSTNPGQLAGELGKVASGGELARISLAIQVVTASKRSVPTLIFDEVDVGIGGGIAEIVGKHLRKLAETQQVICITHLPQVASQAHQQLQVSKKHDAENTHIEISQLSHEQRIEEIARMLGGVNLTEKTCLHAEEMLAQAQQG